MSDVVMTNDPLDPEEAPQWERGAAKRSDFTRCSGWTGS